MPFLLACFLQNNSLVTEHPLKAFDCSNLLQSILQNHFLACQEIWTFKLHLDKNRLISNSLYKNEQHKSEDCSKNIQQQKNTIFDNNVTVLINPALL